MTGLSSQDWQVVGIGIGTVFVGLICIILICKIMSIFCNMGKSSKKDNTAAAAPVSNTPAVIENRQEIIAAVCAVAAEELGTDISAIRVISFKKL